jgi:hypothetical protein
LEAILADVSSENMRRGALIEEIGAARQCLEMDLADLKAALVRTEIERETASRKAAETSWRLSQIEASTSWRAFGPIRWLGRQFPAVPRLLRRAFGRN